MYIKIVDEKGRITLPHRLRSKLGLIPDTIVSLTEKDGDIVLHAEKICTNCRDEKTNSEAVEAFELLSPSEKNSVIEHLLKTGRGSDGG